MIKIILTTHTKQRMSERGIRIQQINETIEFPDYNITKNKKAEAYKKLRIKH